MYIKLLKSLSKILIASFIFLPLNNFSFAQDLLNDAKTANDIELGENSFSETINIISRSGKIFILSNSNQLLSKGDFLTMSLKEAGPVARAVVAKTYNGEAGIKILKVYSLSRWRLLKKGLDVNILKGDDSALFVEKIDKPDEDDGEAKIDSEEDLYNDKTLENDEDLDSFYKNKRHIKPDNIVSMAWSQYNFSNDITGDKETHNQWVGSWAFQFADNYWVEGLYGRTFIEDLPAKAAETIINNYTIRFKYTIKAPLYSYIMPYIGFQTFAVSSPTAGQTTDTTRANQEKALIDKLKSSNIALGITVLRRLVPGWFLKADLGNDIVNIGFGIEF